MSIKTIVEKIELNQNPDIVTESKIDWKKVAKKHYSKSKKLYDKLRDSKC